MTTYIYNNSITPTPTTASRTTAAEREHRIYSSASMASSKQVLVVIVVVTVATFLAAPVPALAADLLVGDSQGWRLDVDYDDWVNGNDFIVGDTLGTCYVRYEHN